jgi:hypothetical protein
VNTDPLQRAAQATEEARRAHEARDVAIREAHLAGWSIRAIRDATGLSVGRVHQVLKGEGKP